jgi:NAD(P)-dependent dehydrogenase (short-subunit alcohol dehydrogenase family)
VNVSTDAAVNAYAGWGAYGSSKAALLHLTKIWQEELGPLGVRFLSFDPGDMDTPLHAAAVPDADRSTLKSPATSAHELTDLIVEAVRPAATLTVAGVAEPS